MFANIQHTTLSHSDNGEQRGKKTAANMYITLLASISWQRSLNGLRFWYCRSIMFALLMFIFKYPTFFIGYLACGRNRVTQFIAKNDAPICCQTLRTNCKTKSIARRFAKLIDFSVREKKRYGNYF